jgi:hypothetical protein
VSRTTTTATTTATAATAAAAVRHTAAARAVQGEHMNDTTATTAATAAGLESTTTWWTRPAVNLDHARSHPLLTIRGNPKLDKGTAAAGRWGAVLHLAPFTTVPGANVCRAAAAAGCYRACLWRAGRGGLTPLARPGGVAYARFQRTAWYHHDPAGFTARLEHETLRFIARARRAGLEPFIRLNGTSDIPWETYHPRIVDAIIATGAMMVDYTKLSDREPPAGYHLIWSYSDMTRYRDGLESAMDRYGRAAVVFRVRPGTRSRAGDPLPSTFNGYPVVDGDAHDMWWTHPRGSIVGLRLKGRHAWSHRTPLAVNPVNDPRVAW